jgi:hypothetical protein
LCGDQEEKEEGVARVTVLARMRTDNSKSGAEIAPTLGQRDAGRRRRWKQTVRYVKSFVSLRFPY